MKRFFAPILALLALLALPLRADVITTNFVSLANGGIIPDNDVNGWASTINLSSYSGLTVDSVTVNLTIVDGWNGDLYGYLVHDTGGFVVLMNRVGQTESQPFGFSNSGFDDITIASSGLNLDMLGDGGASYSSTAAISTGTYAAQATSGSFSSFQGSSVDGAWTLFFADMSGGDVSQVTSWSLTINAVPEPTTWAMIIFAAGFGGWRFVSWRKKTA